MTTRIVHVAGQPMRLGFVARQRCQWCGEPIIDDDLSNAMSPDPFPEPYGVHVFPVGAFVAIEQRGGFRQTAVLEDTHELAADGSRLIQIPPDFCGTELLRPKLALVTPLSDRRPRQPTTVITNPEDWKAFFGEHSTPPSELFLPNLVKIEVTPLKDSEP